MGDLAKGRATVIDRGDTLQIIIPGKKHPLAIFMSIFFCVFLIGGWSTALVTVIKHILEAISKGDTTNLTFILTWLIGWTIGGIFFLIIILWIWVRKETITLSQNILRIERKVLGIGKSRRYSLPDVKNCRLNTSAGSRNVGWGFGSWSGGFDFWGFSSAALAFDYGMRIIRFAYEIDEPEANYLLGLFQQRGIDVSPSPEVERRLKKSETELPYKDTGVEKTGWAGS